MQTNRLWQLLIHACQPTLRNRFLLKTITVAYGIFTPTAFWVAHDTLPACLVLSAVRCCWTWEKSTMNYKEPNFISLGYYTTETRVQSDVAILYSVHSPSRRKDHKSNAKYILGFVIFKLWTELTVCNEIHRKSDLNSCYVSKQSVFI